VKKKHEEHENHERWLVSYADFITLLFAFFVVLYATSNSNTEKEKKLEESIRQNFGMAMAVGAGGGSGSGQGASPFFGAFDSLSMPTEFPKRAGPAELQDYVERVLDKTLTKEEKKEAITSLRHDSMGVRVTLAASTFFPIGSAKMRLPALQALDKVAAVLKQTDLKVLVEGHTDDLPVTGGQFETNWELAGSRASSVVRYLSKVHKIDTTRMAAISYADQRPVTPNTDEESRAKNRRIELLIVTDRDLSL
jgi:chemotaxis protein MotB